MTGRVPRDLDGRYLRTGPNALGVDDPRAHHWMLGDGMVHGVRLRGGRAEWYRNRWVRSSQVARKLGEPYPGQAPPDDFACNTHVIPYKGRILALQESGPLPYELDGELNTVRPYDFRSTLKGAFTAHTKYDAAADELHAVAYYPTWDHVRHLVIDGTGRVARSTRIPVADAPMMHDFALTGKYVVIVDVPITFDMAAAEAGAPVPYVWNPKHPMRVGVMPRSGGATRWFEIDPVFYSHTLNAYDQGDTVVLELTTMPAPFYVAGRGNGGPSTTGTPALDRWTVDLRAGRVTSTRLDDLPQEFPASTSPWCRGATASPTQRAPRRCGAPTKRSTGCRRTTSSPTAWSSTTCCAAAGRCTASRTARRPESRCSCHAAEHGTRTTATSCPTCTIPTAEPATW